MQAQAHISFFFLFFFLAPSRVSRLLLFILFFFFFKKKLYSLFFISAFYFFHSTSHADFSLFFILGTFTMLDWAVGHFLFFNFLVFSWIHVWLAWFNWPSLITCNTKILYNQSQNNIKARITMQIWWYFIVYISCTSHL